LLSDMITSELSLPVAVLMGANVARDVVQDAFVEATLACQDASLSQELAKIFDCPSFRIQTTTDVTSVELCGAVKNVIAMGGGFCDGLDMGPSTKAAILRRGMVEMAGLCQKFSKEFDYTIMMESCGVADVIATSFGGRNRRCSEEYVRRKLSGNEFTWKDIERDMLNGQKLQGLGTLDELVECIDNLGCKEEFPLIDRIYGISRRDEPPASIVSW
jgi:glycerol-3-phosphate dehydrogenase (NAD+)